MLKTYAKLFLAKQYYFIMIWEWEQFIKVEKLREKIEGT
jgi:hypothetical protein